MFLSNHYRLQQIYVNLCKFWQLIYSVIVTLISLFIFGYYKSKLTGQPVFKGAIKVTAIGAIAAAAAFGIAKLFA